jgi:hypothetical protein
MNIVSIIEEHKTGTEERIMQIWSLYEKVRNVVSRANHLLGPFILLSNGSEFIMISCMSYSIHLQFQNHSLDPVFYLHHHIGSFHLAPGIMRCSWINYNAHSFKTTVAAFLTENWFLLTDRERHVVEAVLTRLQDPLLLLPWIFTASVVAYCCKC